MKRLVNLVFLFVGATTFAQVQRDFQQETLLLNDALAKNHYSPRILNDQFAKDVFHHLLQKLDPERMYFTAEEVNTLRQASRSIDDELNGKGWTFFNALRDHYKKGIERYATASAHLLQSPFNW